MKTPLLAAAVLAALCFVPAAQAADGDADGWTGTGELGFAMSRGNNDSENLNAKLDFKNEDDQWKHHFYAAVLHAKGNAYGDFDLDGIPETRYHSTANRYELGADSALKFSDVSYWVAALRYENDDFAVYESQATFSLGYGHSFINNEHTTLNAEIGPGYRRATFRIGPDESEAIARGVLDYSHHLTASTDLTNRTLVEAGSDNTYIQNDFGVAVKINADFALKAGLQWRHNTATYIAEKNDTLTTVNLVYNFK